MNLEEDFRTCACAYGSRPFWAWNCQVTENLVKEQLPYFQEMGMGGCIIHARTGLKTPFMGEEFLRLVSLCTEEAKRLGMKIWLYDDDRWPSGYGGGLVTEKREYRAGYLVISTWKKEEFAGNTLPGKYGRLDLTHHGNGELAALYKSAGRKGDQTYYVYWEKMEDTPWFNGQAYVDTMNPEAVRAFLDRIYKPFMQQAGQQVEGIFTDEPQVLYKRFYQEEEQREGVWTAVLPFGRELKEAFEIRTKNSFWDALPLILWDEGDLGDGMRYWYHRICLEQFAGACCDQVGKWCRDHGTILAGHLRGEGSLESQTASLGEAMRNYREFQIPGVDILCDKREYNTLKQCQSVVRQMGRTGMCSEMYGVTGWDFSYAAHKLQGDWQAALGVTHRIHHLAWMSMEGEAKRDFPASIFYQLPWYRQYWKLETYFGRLSMVLERGKPRVRIGVIHPIESFWMAFGVKGKQQRREDLEQAFERLTRTLLTGLWDFDFISEALLEQQEERRQCGGAQSGGIPLSGGAMAGEGGTSPFGDTTEKAYGISGERRVQPSALGGVGIEGRERTSSGIGIYHPKPGSSGTGVFRRGTA